MNLLRAQVERQLDDGIRHLSDMGTRARAYLASSAISLTLAGGLLANLGRLESPWESTVTILMFVAVLLFPVVGFFAYVVDKPADVAVGADPSEVRNLVLKRAYSEDEIAWAVAAATLAALEQNDSRIRKAMRSLRYQMLAFNLQVFALGVAMAISVASHK